MVRRPVGFVLAAGLGTRLRPLTELRPKPLCPVGATTLLDAALASVAPHVDGCVVNASWLAEQIVAHLHDRPDVTVSVERPRPLGSAGALVHARPLISGRDVLLRNADTWLQGSLDQLADGWDGRRVRLLVAEPGQGEPADFGAYRYVGAALLPATAVASLPPDAFGLYRLMWLPAWERGDLDLVVTDAVAVDCGTPADYLRANLLVSGGESVVGAGAVVEGDITRCVVWPGAVVSRGERLVDCIRADGGLTVDAVTRDAPTRAE